jgi:hypothetical protein
VTAFNWLANAAREYERGLPRALRSNGDGASALSLRAPVRVLDRGLASEMTDRRRECTLAAATAADALGLRYMAAAVFDSKWPIWHWEVLSVTSALERRMHTVTWRPGSRKPEPASAPTRTKHGQCPSRTSRGRSGIPATRTSAVDVSEGPSTAPGRWAGNLLVSGGMTQEDELPTSMRRSAATDP